MVSESMDISFLIVNYNTAQITRDCVQSILTNKSLSQHAYEIIIIDNQSTDNSDAVLGHLGPHVKYIKNLHNVGFGAANNLAAGYAQGAYLLLLNSDTLAHQTDFSILLKQIQLYNGVGFVGVKVLNSDNTIQTIGHRFPSVWQDFKLHVLFSEFKVFKKIRFFHYQEKGMMAQDWISGCFMLISKAHYCLLDGFDDHIFMYAEDIDICYRAAQLGLQNYVYDKVNVIHLHGKSSANKKPSLRRQLKYTKNYFYVLKKNRISHFVWLIRCFTYYNLLVLWLVHLLKYRFRR